MNEYCYNLRGFVNMNILPFGAFAIFCCVRTADEDKRLLLTDSETLLSQIHALQLEVQQLKGLTTENQELRHDIADLQSRLRTIESRNQHQGLDFFSVSR